MPIKAMTVELLKRIPKNAPSWAVGLVTVLAMLGTLFIAIGITFKTELVRIIAEEHALEVATVEQVDAYERKEADDKNKHLESIIQSVLGLVNSHSNQFVEVAKQVGITQQQNIMLTERVALLEQEIGTVRGSLSECEGSLRRCLTKGK